ncbi:hypothetical protein PV646_06210, partial [Streptomyces sp. ID05-26A]|nr:hypothetical protein [Streptomyces sp. ID05-26A]
NATTGQPIHELTGHTNWIQSVAWSPDGTHILTGSGDNTTRFWNATTGEQEGEYLVFLPGDEFAVFESGTDALIGCTDGAWRWLGWSVVRDQRIDRLPAESFGPLPPLPA